MAANPDKLKLLQTVSHKAALFSVARVPGGGRAFLGASDFKVYETDLSQSKIEFKELGGHESYVTCVALSGKVLISGGYDGKLIWWDIEKRSHVRAVEAHKKWIRNIVVTPDGKTAISVADDMVARVWEVSSGKQMLELRGHQEKTPHHFPSMLYAVVVAPDGKHVATGDKVGHVVVWELATGKQVATCEAPVMYTWDPVQRVHSIGGIRSLAFSPDGEALAVGGMGKVGNIDHLEGKSRVEVFDWKKGQRTHEFPGDRFSGLVNHLEFHPKGDWLLGAGGAGEGFLQFFDLKGKKVLRQEKVAMHVHDVASADDGESLCVAGHNKLCTYEMKG